MKPWFMYSGKNVKPACRLRQSETIWPNGRRFNGLSRDGIVGTIRDPGNLTGIMKSRRRQGSRGPRSPHEQARGGRPVRETGVAFLAEDLAHHTSKLAGVVPGGKPEGRP